MRADGHLTRSTLLCLALASTAGCGAAAETASSSERASAGDDVEPAAEPPERGPADPVAAAIVAAHDARRAEHCAPPLAWSDELASVAQAWADRIGASGCTLEHSSGPYGENLAAGTAGTLTPEDLVAMWYGEASSYDYRRAVFSMQTGHFTQVVWLETAHIGCGRTSCGGMEIFVCNYDPPGNVRGSFEQNVLPTSCR